LWILTESWTNTPIQEIESVVSTGTLDIVKTTSSFTAYISDDYKVSWTGSVLAFLKDWAGVSCKDLLNKDSLKLGQDWVYYINPTWTWSFQVYCDMITDGGWWTLVANIQWINTTIDANSYLFWLGIPNLNDISTWDWIISAGLYDSIWQMIRINMWTVKDYFKPIIWSNLKSMVITFNKHTWCNSADWVFKIPTYHTSTLWWSSSNWPSSNISWDSRQYLSFWWWLSWYSWCCHNSISLPGGAARHKTFRMWVR
jgi:hypothetical protein